MVQLAKPDLDIFGFEDLDCNHEYVPQKAETALFCLFWARWVEESKLPRQQVLEQVDRLMGVSATHILRILSELIANTFSHPRYNSTVITGPHQSPVIQRARKGTLELLKLPDEGLAKTFLKEFIENQSLPHPGEHFQARRSKNALQQRAKTLVETYLDNPSCLANPNPLPLRARTLVGTYLDNPSCLANPNPRYDPTIASSPSSSDLSWKAFRNSNRKSKIKGKVLGEDFENRKSSVESLTSNHSLFNETMRPMVFGYWK
jgi:hypothetical protein